MIFGLILVCLGILYFIEILVPGFSVNYKILWSNVLMIVSLYYMIKDRKISFWNTFLFFVGLWLLLVNLDIIVGDYRRLFYPIMLIIVGGSIVFNAVLFSDRKTKTKEYTNEDILNFHAIFGGVEEKVNDDDFKGANIYSIFGGSEIDLSDIELKQDNVVITVYSIFGGTEISLPKDKYNIVFNSTGIFGANENKSNTKRVKGRKTIYLNCFAIFGGTDIK